MCSLLLQGLVLHWLVWVAVTQDLTGYLIQMLSTALVVKTDSLGGREDTIAGTVGRYVYWALSEGVLTQLLCGPGSVWC